MRGLAVQERRVIEIVLEPSLVGLFRLIFQEATIEHLITQRRLTLSQCPRCGENHELVVTADGKSALEIARMIDNTSAAPAGW